jgi:hypothetical protein
MTGTTNKVTATVAAVPGAVAYAWFYGTAGNELLGRSPRSTRRSHRGGDRHAERVGGHRGQQRQQPDLRRSARSGHEGGQQRLRQVARRRAVHGGRRGGIVEIDAALQYQWDINRLSPDTMWVNSAEALKISRLITADTAAGTSNMRYTADIKDGMVVGGIMAKEYLNRFSMAVVRSSRSKSTRTCPPVPDPHDDRQAALPAGNVGNVMQIRCRQDYYQIEWPLRSRKYEYGVYADEVLQHYFPASMCVIQNIG